MPTSLIAKRPPELSIIGQVLVVVFIGGPIAGIWHFGSRHQAIHFDNPWLNYGAHAALFVFPLIWAGMITYKPVVYESMDRETILGSSTYFDRWPANWWMMFMMWAAPVVTLILLGQSYFTHYLPHPEALSTSPSKAVGIMAVTTVLGLFYATLLLSRSDPVTWISDAGLRTSILRFHKWESIDHVSKHGDLYAFYHRVNSSLPANSFKVRDLDGKAVLERYLSQNHIPILNDTAPAFFRIKVGVILGFLVNIAFSLWLRFNASLSFLVVVLISFGLGILTTIVLEKIRGVSDYGKYMPIIEPPIP